MNSAFFSNRVEFLYQEFKKKLFVVGCPFAKRLIIVPNPSMKLWLTLQLANDPDIGIGAGLKILDIDHALVGEILPSSTELALGIEAEIRASIKNYPPLIEYLELSERELRGDGFSPRSNRRIVTLSIELAYLFQRYGKYGEKMLKKWKIGTSDDWQQQLWRNVYRKQNWRILHENLQENLPEVHLFCISHICRLYHDFLMKKKVHYYLLSPCQFFWSDLSRSERYGNTLLANLGKLGREMARQIEESQIETDERYGLPEGALHVYQELLTGDEVVENDGKALTLLEAVQTDMLLMREHSQLALNSDNSLLIYAAATPLREVQILHDQLLDICLKENLKPGDICVMAPNIRDYEPYIQMVFKPGPFSFQINDGNSISQSDLIQIFMFFIRLPFGRWDAPSMLKIFEHPRFRKKHGLREDDVSLIHFWIKEARINWGADVQHRNELLKQSYSEKGISDENPAGTWERGFQRLIFGLALDHSEELLPLTCVETTEMELLGKWIFLMRSLRQDLSLIASPKEMTVLEWVEFLEKLLEKYFSTEDESKDLQEQLNVLRAFTGEETYPFTTILHHLEVNLEKKNAPYREHDLNAVRFSSLLPMRTTPAKVIALIGLCEGNYPGKECYHPLDRLGKEGDYIPSQVDYDRFLFLEVLLSAREHFFISYQTDGGSNLPSILISEFIHYCNQNYIINGKIASEILFKEHPESPYDPIYFTKNSPFKSYSQFHYQLAKAHLDKKTPKHCFIPSFTKKSIPLSSHYHVTLEQLKAFAKNPIRSYFRHSLNFSIREEEKKNFANELFSLSPIERYQIRKEALSQSFMSVIKRAEKEGRIPFGAFKAWTIGRLEKEVQESERNRSLLGEDLVIELSERHPTLEYENKTWKIPALQIECSPDLQVTLTGSLTDVTSLGLIAKKDEFTEALKAWPLLLVLSCLNEEFTLPIKPQVNFLKNGVTKTSFYTKPRKLLGCFLHYYIESLHRISPLIPELVPDILSKDAAGLTKSMNQKLNGPYQRLYNDDLLWALRGGNLPDSQTLLKDWKEVAEELYSELYMHWYSR